jgi:hypothetical protein
MNPPDRLSRVLDRALRRAALARDSKAALKRKSLAKTTSEDYAARLAEKHLYRGLLSDERFDGLRFRWYFTHIQTDIDLDQLRSWIDKKVVEEDRRARKTAALARTPPKDLPSEMAPAEQGSAPEARPEVRAE